MHLASRLRFHRNHFMLFLQSEAVSATLSSIPSRHHSHVEVMEYSVEPWVLAPVSSIIPQPAERDWIVRRVGAPAVSVGCELEKRGFRFDPDWNDSRFSELALLGANLICLIP